VAWSKAKTLIGVDTHAETGARARKPVLNPQSAGDDAEIALAGLLL
jgi:hypothetical protein